MHVCIYLSIYLCLYVSMCLCVYVSMYLCMYLHAQGSHCHFLAFDYHINVSCQYLWTVYTLSTYIHITSCHGGNMLMERWLHLFPLECFAPERWEVILTSYSLKCDACSWGGLDLRLKACHGRNCHFLRTDAASTRNYCDSDATIRTSNMRNIYIAFHLCHDRSSTC